MIEKNWQELIKPPKLEIDAGDLPKRMATIVADPLERGFGLTLGNALRRVLLSSLQGAAAGDANLMPYILEAVRAYATLGEITDCLRDAWGEYLPFGDSRSRGPKAVGEKTRSFAYS